jgi:hypothetical protein
MVLFLLAGLLIVAGVNAQTGKTYTDVKNGFSVAYPDDFKVVTGKAAASETAMGDPGIGKKLVKITPKHIPEKYHGDYEFSVWSGVTKDNCAAPVADEEIGIPIEVPAEGAKTRMIGGHTFYAYGGSEGGMSKSMGISGFRGIVGKRCWQIQSMIYQVSAFDDFKGFDGKIIDKAFEKFVASFKFKK